MQNDNIYKDIQTRTNGEIYIGVVGPVRSGKSTFIKKFMDEVVIPNMRDDYTRKKARDELPQSASGRAVMTTEPKFIPDDPIEIAMADGCKLRVKMIDCVGFMIPGAMAESDGTERMVMTPWSETAMPFGEAAELGTQKVIREHSTIGLIVTSDGTIGEIPRQNYTEAEEHAVEELKALGKPFAIVLNSAHPDSEEANTLAMDLEEKYQAPVALVNCLELDAEDIQHILQLTLMEFPIKEIRFHLPKWTAALDSTHWLMQSVRESIDICTERITKTRDVREAMEEFKKNPNLSAYSVKGIDMGNGYVTVALEPMPELYFKIMGELTGLTIKDEEELFRVMRELSAIRTEHEKYRAAIEEVNEHGYGIVMPNVEDLSLDEPEILRQAGGYGIKLKAKAPSIHMIKASIETELNPIVGSEAQTEEIVRHLANAFEEDPIKLWESNLFGKSLYELVFDGLQGKVEHISEESRIRLSDTLSRVINEGSGGLLCIIL